MSYSMDDDFMLSLFGYDAKGDYFRITQEMVGRRVNLAAPDQSLLLLKATGKVPHTGGELFKPDTKYYQTLLKWNAAGAPDDARPHARPRTRRRGLCEGPRSRPLVPCPNSSEPPSSPAPPRRPIATSCC